MWVIDLSWFKLSWGIYLTLKESKYTAVFLLINDKTQCVPLIFLSSKFMTYAPSFILSKLFLEKRTIKYEFVSEVISNLDIV